MVDPGVRRYIDAAALNQPKKLQAGLPLTFVLSIPFWLWTDRRWRRRLERRISEEVERRIAEGRKRSLPSSYSYLQSPGQELTKE
jgi:hypothetical protein